MTPPPPLIIAGGNRNFDYGKYEGKHAKRNLKQIQYHSKIMYKLLKDSDDLPDWIHTKVTLATDYIDSASHYLKNRVEEIKKFKKKKQTRKQIFKHNKNRKTYRRY